MYCAWRIPEHLRSTQCSILLHHMDICFLTCICLWQISQIQTCLFKVVGPGLVSTSPAFVSSSASHPAGPKNGKSGSHCWGRGGSTLPNSIYAKDNGDSLTFPSTGHLSYSSATIHCNHYIRIVYIRDPVLISSMFQIDASSKVSSSRFYLYTSKIFLTG